MRRRRPTLLYRIYLRSPVWRIRRRVWIIRAGGRCQRCHSRRRLTIHHRTYRRLGHERRADIAVLCWRCHRREHAPHRARSIWRNWWPLAYGRRETTPASASRATSLRLALLILIALSAMVALGSWIPRR